MTQDVETIIRDLRMIVFDFDGVFTDNRVIVMQDGSEAVICSRAEGFGLDAMRELGIELLVISTEKNPVVGVRCNKLKLRCIQSCDDKRQVLRDEAAKLDIPLDHIAYIGNDINDIGCMELVGLPVCVADAHPDAMVHAIHVTQASGGDGAVREFCDRVSRIKHT